MTVKENQLIEKLLSLNLPVDDYAVFGSGCMLARGIINTCHDIDVIARGAAWEKVCSLGKTGKTKMGNGQVATFFDDQVEIFSSWAPGEWDINSLIDNAEIIDGLRFVTLDHLVRWMRLMSREKDFARIKLVENYLEHAPQ